MNRNLGGFTIRGFVVGFGVCLLVALLIYRQFDFVEAAKSDDVAITRTTELANKLEAMQTKIDKLEARLSQAEAKLQKTEQSNKHNKKSP